MKRGTRQTEFGPKCNGVEDGGRGGGKQNYKNYFRLSVKMGGGVGGRFEICTKKAVVSFAIYISNILKFVV